MTLDRNGHQHAANGRYAEKEHTAPGPGAGLAPGSSEHAGDDQPYDHGTSPEAIARHLQANIHHFTSEGQTCVEVTWPGGSYTTNPDDLLYLADQVSGHYAPPTPGGRDPNRYALYDWATGGAQEYDTEMRRRADRAAAQPDSGFSGFGWGSHRPQRQIENLHRDASQVAVGDVLAVQRQHTRNLARVVRIEAGDKEWGDPDKVWLTFADPNDPSKPRRPDDREFDAYDMDVYYSTGARV